MYEVDTTMTRQQILNNCRSPLSAALGALMLDLGLLLMLLSFVYGLGVHAGLFALAGGPLLIVGILFDRTPARIIAFAVGLAIGCCWIYMAWNW